MRFLPFLALVWLISCSTEKKQSVEFNYDEYFSYLSALSHDSTMGRAPGSVGYDKSAAYCVNLLKQWGYQPAGDNGSWYQSIRFTEATKNESSLKGFVIAGGRKINLDPVNNFVARPLVALPASDLKNVPIVFAGFGIDAPELGYNSYDGIDVKGKIVLLVHGAPKNFNNEASAIYGSALQKGNTAVSHGAIGAMTVFPPIMNVTLPFIRNNAVYAMGWSHPSGTHSDNNPDLQINARISTELASDILGSAQLKLNETIDSLFAGKVISGPLQATLTASITYNQKTFDSPNIVAMLPGTDPRLKDEIIVMTAHLDHIGTRPSNGQDSIYNGTLDNASGSAALLSIAHRLSTEKHARTIVCVLLNAEELGLLGSDYFARYPTVPRDRIVANMNMDGMTGLIVKTKDFIAYGYEYSNLSTSVDQALAATGTTLGKDLHPEQAYFVRSDQFSFVRQGIPAIYLTGGNFSSDTTIDASRIFTDWIGTRYHQPSDDLQQPLNKDGLLHELNAEYLLLADMLDRKDKIQWKKGSFLYERYGR